MCRLRKYRHFEPFFSFYLKYMSVLFIAPGSDPRTNFFTCISVSTAAIMLTCVYQNFRTDLMQYSPYFMLKLTSTCSKYIYSDLAVCDTHVPSRDTRKTTHSRCERQQLPRPSSHHGKSAPVRGHTPQQTSFRRDRSCTREGRTSYQ